VAINPVWQAQAEAGPGETSVPRRLIVRPRLFKLLETVPSRVNVLVGPAGYGKTTLARQWIKSRDRRGLWYRGSPASVDVAALVLGLAQAIEPEVPGSVERTSRQLHGLTRPDDRADDLAEILCEGLMSWPANTWLIIDDYQFLTPSPSSERVIERLTEADQLNMLVTTRERPNWATPRRILYGEINEIARSTLALTLDEAAELVGGSARSDLRGLLALTEGWPAVIGLAALASDKVVGVENPFPESLYKFFAEELFQVADPTTQAGLVKLSLLPSLPADELVDLLGEAGSGVLEQAERLGFLSSELDDVVDLHPLLRAFLRTKVAVQSDAFIRTTKEVLPFLMETSRWDEACALITDYSLSDHFAKLVECALYPLLDAGRIATLEQWTALGRQFEISHPAIELMEAEILFRAGNWIEAERLSVQAAVQLPPDSPITSRAYFRAGQSAQLDDRLDDGLSHHMNARHSARSRDDLSQSLWGVFITQSELEAGPDAMATLEEFDRTRTTRTEDELRAIGGRITLAVRIGGLEGVVRPLQEVEHLLRRRCDPVVSCGFLQTLGSSLTLTGRYKDALEAIRLEIDEARNRGLSFVLPHAYCSRAVAFLGLRQFQNCDGALRAAEDSASRDRDVHIQMNVRAIRGRLHLARGEIVEAIRLTEPVRDANRAAPGMAGDYLGTRAVALACASEPLMAVRAADEALSSSRQVEARVLAAAARAIAAHQKKSGSVETSTLIDEMHETGNADSVICAYRGFPALLVSLRREMPSADFSELIERSGDARLARKLGLEISEQRNRDRLSRREREVLELLQRGLTNRAIAQSFWISEATVKVHVRNILRKLGVRSRTEAAVIGAYADTTAGSGTGGSTSDS
jgi:ATP/maltotriose-dependent transcriptional regulator MalT